MNFLYTDTVFFSEFGAMPHSKQLCGNCLGFTSGRATEPAGPRSPSRNLKLGSGILFFHRTAMK